jgi:hypothetical protein
MWHVKDMHKVSRDYTELGNGSIDFTKIWPDTSLAGMKHFLREIFTGALRAFTTPRRHDVCELDQQNPVFLYQEPRLDLLPAPANASWRRVVVKARSAAVGAVSVTRRS